MDEKLYLHCGAMSATKEDLAAAETPSATKTWEPIPHITIVETLLAEAERINFKVTNSAFGLSKSKQQMFGVLDFDTETNDYSYAVGFRNSHDKSWAAGICAGHRVFVCDNLAFNGDYVEKRKHTVGNGFIETIKDAFAYIPQKLEEMTKNLDRLKRSGLSDDEARLLVFKAFEEKAISSSRIGQVWNEYKQPKFEEFSEPTKFNLLMAFTEIAKQENSVMALERMYARTAPIFDLN
jgi:hypothetical protein